MKFEPILYKTLNSRQKENYNFFQAASILSQYGFNCIRLSDDWHGADFVAYHINGIDVLRVQLKSRFLVDKKYKGKDLHVCFMHQNKLHLYSHDDLLAVALKINDFSQKKGWIKNGIRSWKTPPKKILNYLNENECVLERLV
jgi:hypothetical protein